MTDLSTLWAFELSKGNSKDPRKGACLLDAVSWLEYGHLGDHPECVCPVIAAYGRIINDLLPHAERQRLRVYIPRLVGTVDKAAESARTAAIGRHAERYAPERGFSGYGFTNNEKATITAAYTLTCVARFRASTWARICNQYDPVIAGLDVMLAIGRQAEPVPVARYREAVRAFEMARA